MPVKAGQEIDAYCTRCKMDLTHRIIAVVGDKPVKVECRTCMGTHNYRAPKSAPAARAAREAPAAASSSSRSAAAPKPRRTAPEEHVALVPPDHARVHAYRMTETFQRDQWVAHKTFGIGLVLAVLADDKIEVRFESGHKVLVHNRPLPT